MAKCPLADQALNPGRMTFVSGPRIVDPPMSVTGIGSTGGKQDMTTDWVPPRSRSTCRAGASSTLPGAFRSAFAGALRTQPFTSCSAQPNATDSRCSNRLGHLSISPVAAQNQPKHSAPLNRPHVTNGVSPPRSPPCRRIDSRGSFEMQWSSRSRDRSHSDSDDVAAAYLASRSLAVASPSRPRLRWRS